MNLLCQVKTIPKEKAVFSQKYDSELFVKKFRNHIADAMKSKRETREIFTDSKKLFPWSSSYPPRQSERQNIFSPKADNRITENSIMVAASFVKKHKQVNKDIVNIHSSSRTFFNMDSVPEISLKLE